MVKWNAVYNRLIPLLDEGDAYFSGPKFIRKVQEFDPNLSDYSDFKEERERAGKSTTRRVYFRDILKELPEALRLQVVQSILSDISSIHPHGVAAVRSLLGGEANAPVATIPASAWNAERLNNQLGEIDSAIAIGTFDRAVSLSYTCMEGFLGAFLRAKCPRDSYPKEIIALAKEVRDCLAAQIQNYPDEVLNLIKHTAHAVDRARNRFSEAHFGDEAGSWLATYVRDLVNSEIRLLLHFM